MKRSRTTSTNTITVPGFKFAGVACGIKKRKKDLALIVSERPATAAALFTTNQVQAAPVVVGRERVKKGKLQAVVVNSGNANACTGARGLRDAESMRAGHPAAILESSPPWCFRPLPGLSGFHCRWKRSAAASSTRSRFVLLRPLLPLPRR